MESTRSLAGKGLRATARRRRLLPWLLGAAVAAACSGPPRIGPPPIQAPSKLAAVVRSHFGTSLTGALATAEGPTPDPAATPILHCELFLLGELPRPGPGATPLQEEVRFVAEPGKTALARGPSRLALRGTRLSGPGLAEQIDLWRRGADGGALCVVDERRPLPRATSCSVFAERAESVDDPEDFLGERKSVGEVSKRFGVSVDAAPDAAHVTLDFADTVRPTPRERVDRSGIGDDAAGAAPRASLEHRHELIRLVTALAPGGEPLVVVLPSPFRDEARGGRPAPACAICLELLPPPRDGDEAAAHAEAVAKVWSEAKAEAMAVAERTALHTPEDVVALALRRAFETLTPEPSSRATLIYVTTATSASFAGDLALVADDAELVGWLRELGGPSCAPPPGASVAAIGWMVERNAWRRVIAEMLSGDLAPEIAATVLRHSGAVGRLATSLEEAVEESGDVPTLERRLVTENLAALEDSSATARVRAFDWLTARGLAPAGFDPLASADERRAALQGKAPDGE